LNQWEESAGNKITAAALQDTDGSAIHPNQFFFEKTLLRHQCHRFRKAFAAMSAIIF
jgi:hypothetical protein